MWWSHMWWDFEDFWTCGGRTCGGILQILRNSEEFWILCEFMCEFDAILKIVAKMSLYASKNETFGGTLGWNLKFIVPILIFWKLCYWILVLIFHILENFTHIFRQIDIFSENITFVRSYVRIWCYFEIVWWCANFCGEIKMTVWWDFGLKISHHNSPGYKFSAIIFG